MAAAAEEQLRLEIKAEASATKPADYIDLVGAMLEAYRGDYRAAIAALLEDADFLRDQLYTASSLISSGMGLGWQPTYERV